MYLTGLLEPQDHRPHPTSSSWIPQTLSLLHTHSHMMDCPATGPKYQGQATDLTEGYGPVSPDK